MYEENGDFCPTPQRGSAFFVDGLEKNIEIVRTVMKRFSGLKDLPVPLRGMLKDIPSYGILVTGTLDPFPAIDMRCNYRFRALLAI